MKAEQRKELETNILADKMGQAMQRVKTSPRRIFFMYFIIAAVLLVAVWFGWRWWTDTKISESEQWLRLYDGSALNIDYLVEKDKEGNAGKAARFQRAWLLYWDFGVKTLATDRTGGSIARLKKAAEEYGILAEDCKDDKVFEPQALLGRACATESLAVQDLKSLDKAAGYYKELVEKYKDSAEGKFAQQRLEILEDKTKKRELQESYTDVRDLLGILPPMPQMPQFPQKGQFQAPP